MLILSVGGIILMLFFVTYASQRHNLNSIKDKTVGNGQHGTARWATQQEVRHTTMCRLRRNSGAWKPTRANTRPLAESLCPRGSSWAPRD